MSSGFVTEKEIEEQRKVRQDEWDRVRKADDPLEAPLPPEQLPDRRSLYERLQEQKNKKQDEFEEAHKLKNLVKVLDDDEADFLDYVDKVKMDEERKKRLEEAKELTEFRNKVAELRDQNLDVMIKQEIGLIKPEKKPSIITGIEDSPSIGGTKTSQTKLLAGIVKRKSQSGSDGSSSSNSAPLGKKPKLENEASDSKADSSTSIDSVPYKGNLVCIGVLPGLASYDDSSSNESEDESTTDSEKQSPPGTRDLCGRRIVDHSELSKPCEKKK